MVVLMILDLGSWVLLDNGILVILVLLDLNAIFGDLTVGNHWQGSYWEKYVMWVYFPGDQPDKIKPPKYAGLVMESLDVLQKFNKIV